MATASHERVLDIACTPSTAIEFVSSPAGRQFSAAADAPSMLARTSPSASSSASRAAATNGSPAIVMLLHVRGARSIRRRPAGGEASITLRCGGPLAQSGRAADF